MATQRNNHCAERYSDHGCHQRALQAPAKNAKAGQFVGYASNSGDYNADGDNRDYPDVVSYS